MRRSKLSPVYASVPETPEGLVISLQATYPLLRE